MLEPILSVYKISCFDYIDIKQLENKFCKTTPFMKASEKQIT